MSSRVFFVDHLRAALVILVVLHHVAIVYGAAAPFYYTEPPFNDPLAHLLLLVFALFNQAWFMGALFLIAGYFTPGSFERKGAREFLYGRLLRLGVPLVVFFFLINPLASIGYWQMPASLTGITTPLTWGAYPYLLGMGPLWFVALLLLFDLGYALLRSLKRGGGSARPRPAPFPGPLVIVAFIVGLAAVTYLTRVVIPMGRDVLGFPTLAYLPQYLSFFVVGAIAYRRDWLNALRPSFGIVGGAAAAVATLLLFPLALSGSPFSLALADPAAFVGNGTPMSGAYALWDSIFAVGTSLAAVVLFRRYFSQQSRLGGFLAQQSYAVYILQTPVIVFTAIALKEVHLEALSKFGVVSMLVVPMCFVVAYGVRRIPYVARVL